jgi:hypothetical protein
MAMATGREKGIAGRLRAWLAAGLLLLPAVVAAQDQAPQPRGRGFVFGGALGGGQLSFPGAGGRALALSPVNGLEVVATWSTAYAYGVRDARVVSAGEAVPGAERVVPFPAREGAGGFSMNGGYAFNRRVAVLLDVEVSGGLASADFNHAVGAVVVRYWPASRLWAQTGPAFGDLGFGFDQSTVRSGSITGDGLHVAAGVSILRKPKWSLDVEARYATVWYDGFRATTATLALGASRLPL